MSNKWNRSHKGGGGGRRDRGGGRGGGGAGEKSDWGREDRRGRGRSGGRGGRGGGGRRGGYGNNRGGGGRSGGGGGGGWDRSNNNNHRRGNRGNRGGGGRRGGYGGRRNERVGISKEAKVHTEKVKRNELLTNYLTIQFNERQLFWVYPMIFPKDFLPGQPHLDRRKKNYVKREVEKALRGKWRTIKESDYVVTPNRIISLTSLTNLKEIWVEDFGEKKKIAFQQCIMNLKKSTYQEIEQLLNEVIAFSLEKDQIFRRNWQSKDYGDGKRFMYKLFDFTTDRDRRREEDYYLTKNIHKCFEVHLVKKASGWFMVVNPGFRTEVKYPNGLELINNLGECRLGEKEISERFSTFSIRSLTYRGQRENPSIACLRYDLHPDSKTDFNKEYGSYMDYIFGKYGRRMRNLRREEVDLKQPMIEVLREEKSDFYIPQLCSIDCSVQDEKSWKQEFITEKTNDGLPVYLNKVVEFLKDLQASEEFLEKMKNFGVTINLEETLTATAVRQWKLKAIKEIGNRGKIFHNLEESFKWQGKTSRIKIEENLKDDFTEFRGNINHQKISFDHILYLFHEGRGGGRSGKCPAEQIMEVILDSAKHRNIQLNPDTIMWKTLNRRGDNWKRCFKDFEKKFLRVPKMVVCCPRYNDILYAPVKSYCMKEGIVCQFIKEENLREKRMRIVGVNVFLQICCKMGAFLWELDELTKPFYEHNKNPTLVIGIECSRHSHQSYKSRDLDEREVNLKKRWPHLYGAVGAIVKDSWTRRCAYILKEDEDDISGVAITDTVNFMLTEYAKKFKGEPPCLVIYRSGVPLSKMHMLKTHEVHCVENVLEKRRKKTFKTKLVFSVVQRRTNTLFFGADGGNPSPGYVINKDIVYPERILKDFEIESDFFMIATENNRIATKPVHYTVVKNEMVGYTNEFVQLCLDLCCMYYNFAGTVQSPFCLKMASAFTRKLNKVCLYLEGEKRNGQDLKLTLPYISLSTGEERDGRKIHEEDATIRIKLHPDIEKGMWEL